MDPMADMEQIVALVGRLEPVHWLTVATAIAFLVLVGVLLMQTRTARRKQRELAQLAGGPAPDYVEADPSGALEGITLSPIDSVFPRQPGRFLLLVAFVAVGTWLLGLALAPDTARFLASAEWTFQPFYIAAHLITLRMFINVYTRNYAAGVSRLQISRAEALRGIRPALGASGALAALVIALPFCWMDFLYMTGPRYERMGAANGVLPVDYLMWLIWSAEWFVNAFVWVLLVGFMVKNCTTIKRYPFKDPIEAVLAEKLYRPFLQMSAQGSTVVLGFSAVTVLYIYATGGELTDYLGLGITVTLLVVCFVPPWLLLRGKVDAAVHAALNNLRRGAGLGVPAGASAVAGERSLEQRMDELAALFKVWHLQHLYGSLGQTEATAIMVRLLPPALTIGWQMAQRHEAITEWVGRLLRASGGA